MFLILFGAPGVGKGTQAEKICSKYNIPQISTGEILRAAIAKNTDLGKKAKILMDKGELVPDDVVLGIIDKRIVQEDCKNGFILDGFPRTLHQAEEFTALLNKHALPAFRCVEISVPDETIIERLLARGRVDDTRETVQRRLKIYQEETAPVKTYYKNESAFFSVDGNKSIEDVFNSINNFLADKTQTIIGA